ncbi:response regulator [Thermodesulfobacteriota bacterium]
MAPLNLREETMEEVIYWLRTLEQLALVVYREAAEQMSDDQEFASFLLRMSEDEELHYILLGKAEDHLMKTRASPRLAIKFDAAIKDELKIPLEDLHRTIIQRKMSRQEVLDRIVKIEFSEWNYIFVYVFNVLQKSSKIFQYAAANIQAHKERIIKFTENLPPALKDHRSLQGLPSIWEHKILIVENEATDRELLSGILNKFGKIEKAVNGQAGLEKIKESFFNVVISGAGSPGMSGIEFYQKATELEPQLSRRFLFCADNIVGEVKDFLRENHLPYLEKPFGIKHLWRLVESTIEKTL